MIYADHLQSVEWKTIRRLKLEEATGRCQLCYSDDRVQVHHRTYDRLGRERLDDLIALCDPCHGRFHEKLPPVPATESPKTPAAAADINARLIAVAKRQRELAERQTLDSLKGGTP